ncbi:Leucine-rich repeat-containing protein 29 [Balamuthia mandrillaris]
METEERTCLVLPLEMWSNVLSFLSKQQLLLVSLVCKEWRDLVFTLDSLRNITVPQRCDSEERLRFLLPLLSERFPLLTRLDMNGCTQLTDELASHLAHLPYLKELRLGNSPQLSSKATTYLPTGLRSLHIHSCRGITDFPHALPSSLLSLSLHHMKQLTGTELHSPNVPSTLTSLDLTSCWNMGGAELQALLPIHFPQLRSLVLRGCKRITNDTLRGCASLTALTALDLGDSCRELNEEGLQHLPSSLLVLKFKGCRLITDEALTFLPRGLHTLSMPYCRFITDEGIKNLPSERLRDLDISFCYHLHDAAIRDLPRGIKVLNLTGLENISNEAIGSLPSGLQRLSLRECYSITDEGIALLPQEIRVLDLSHSKVTFRGLVSLPLSLQCLTLDAFWNPLSSGELMLLAQRMKVGNPGGRYATTTRKRA